MTNANLPAHLPAHLALIDEVSLTPLVQRALDRPAAVVLTWTCETLHGGVGTGMAVYRFAGQAGDQGEAVPWSLILKILWADPSRADPAHPEWWCREAEAYRSNTLERLPAGFAAPRCFAVVEQAGDGYWLWLEEVADSTGSRWSLDHYGVVARLLGQFNGSYLTGTPLPDWPWLSRDWLRKTVELTAPALQKLHENRHHPLVRRWLNAALQEETLALWQERERFLTLLDQLPQTLCHFDAFRRNLFTSGDSAGATRLVAIDWAFTGQGALGVEINCLTVIGIAFFDVELAQAQALDEIVFAGYLAESNGQGWRIPLIPDPPKFQPHPLKTVTDRLAVKNPVAIGVRRAFIHCTAKAPDSPVALAWPAIDRAAEVARQQGWWYRTLPTDHSPHHTMPHELAGLLLDLAH